MSGFLILFSSPSGGGKSTIIKEILKKYPDEFVYSISTTTRTPRPTEINGRDYNFLSKEEFLAKVEKKQFIEWEEVHGYYYGTDLEFINSCLNQSRNVLLDIDVNGALEVASKLREKVITFFIKPPSMEELISRLKNRNTDSPAEIENRLKRIPMEMEKSALFDHVIINDDLEKTVEKILHIIKEHSHK